MGQYSNLKEALTDLIPKHGKSNAEVGRKLGNVSGQLLGQYVKGNREPKTGFFLKWKKAFGEDLQKMIEPDDTKIEKSASIDPAKTIIPGELKITLQQHYDLLTKHANIMARLVERHLLPDTNSSDLQKKSENIQQDQGAKKRLPGDQPRRSSDGKSEVQGRLDEQGNTHEEDKLNKESDKH